MDGVSVCYVYDVRSMRGVCVICVTRVVCVVLHVYYYAACVVLYVVCVIHVVYCRI